MSPLDVVSYSDLLDLNAEAHGTSAALYSACGSISHAELRARVDRVASRLGTHGVMQGDRFAILGLNGPGYFELIGAAARLGAVAVLLNTRASAQETAAVLADSGARCVFVDPALRSLLSEVPARFPCMELADHGIDAGPHGPLKRKSAVHHRPQAPLVAIPTAAVEGKPRLALLSHTALMHQAMRISLAWHLGPADRHLCVLPLFHMAGLGLALAVQSVGGASVLMRNFQPHAAAAAIAAERVSCFASFSPILAAILDAAQSSGADLSSLRAIVGLEPPDVIARLQRQWPAAVFWAAYGQTETGGLVSLSPASERPGASGRALHGVELRIENGAGEAVAVGDVGEIVVRGAWVFSGYLNRPAESAHASRGGWHHTGDLGRLDTDGYLWFAGPAPDKSLIKSGGENIYPAEVEQALRAHPAVQEAVVIGVPDSRWGQAVRAICQLRLDWEVTATALTDFVGTRIARFKRPRDVIFVQMMPRNSEGEIDRKVLAATYGGDGRAMTGAPTSSSNPEPPEA